MKIQRRDFLKLSAGVTLLPAPAVWAQTYPARPVRIVVGFAAGSSSDVSARLIGKYLSDRLGQQFIVDNRPGAGSNIATGHVAKSEPDGYTLLFVNTANAVNATLYKEEVNYSFLRDITAVAGVSHVPAVMEVSNSLPVNSVPEFIAYAKANGGKINMATIGPGTAQHLYGALFMMMTGIEMVPVHYRGAAQAITDLIAGRVQVMFDIIVSSIGYVKSGQIKALAVTTEKTQDALPGVPTVGQFVPGYEAGGWQGLGAPAGTPPEVIDRLNKGVNAALADPAFKTLLNDLGGTPFPASAPEFGKFMAAQTEKWAKVIQAANIKPT
jgi:tripartite-type tricarboxylate transporter receptor subunit TctC